MGAVGMRGRKREDKSRQPLTKKERRERRQKRKSRFKEGTWD